MPYYKRNEKCKNASGEPGNFVTIKKDGGKRQCWKSKKAFEKAIAARHAQGVSETMNFTEERLFEIILEEIALMEGFLKPQRTPTTEPIDDDEIEDIVRASDLVRMSRLNKRVANKKLNEVELPDELEQRIVDLYKRLGSNKDAIIRIAKKLALPIAMITGVVGGALTGAQLAADYNASTSSDTEISVKQSNSIINKLGLSAIAGKAFDGEQFHGMTNDEKVALAWSKFDVGSSQAAPVSSSVPIFKFAMIPIDQINENTVLPMIGATAGDYYKFLKMRVEANPNVELPLLKNIVYGNVGKWAGGVGGGDFKTTADGRQILPPDWTVAYTLYADLMEERLISILDHHELYPEQRKELYDSLGVSTENGFYKFIGDGFYKIGRPLQQR